MGWEQTGVFTEKEIAIARKTMLPHKFAQEMECSFNAAITGSYYGDALDKLQANQKIGGHIKFDPNYAVHTAWDLGIRDKMAVWFYQLIPVVVEKRFEIRVIDYEEQSGYGFADWAQILKNRSNECGYRSNLF